MTSTSSKSRSSGGGIKKKSVRKVRFPNSSMVVRRLNPYRIIKLFSLAGALYYIGISWLVYNATGDLRICPLAVFCGATPMEMGFMTVSRSSAGLMYPTYFVIFLTKCRTLIHFLSKTFLSELVDFRELHDLHKYFGIFMTVDATVHSVFHISRWGVRNELWLLHAHPTGWSGLYTWVMLALIVFPFWFPFLRKRIPFEYRKPLHYLALPWLILLTFHQYPRMFISFWCIFCFYVLDFLVSFLILTHRIENPEFHPVGQGTAILFDVPPSMQGYQAGQYAYINIPWISKHEWHPFSLIASSEGHTKASFYILTAGDWTETLFKRALVHRDKPVMWIHGPHPSPFDASLNFNKLFLLATGVGITPAVSVIEEFYRHREIYLIWSCRDVYMIEFFLKQLGRVHSKVFFTGGHDKFEKLNVLVQGAASRPQLDLTPDGKVEDLEEGLFTEFENGRAVAHTVRQAHKPFDVTILSGRPNLKREILDRVRQEEAEAYNPDSGNTRLASKTFIEKEGGYAELLESSGGSDVSDWMILYCGAAKKVSEQAADICRQNGLAFRTEFFDSW